MRASGYMVQWEQSGKRSKWEKTRCYYPSRSDAMAGADKLKGSSAVRRIEMHALYKR